MTKHAVWLAKSEADCTNQAVVGENCVRNDAGERALTDGDKMKAWVKHYARQLNVEFEWPSNELPEVPPTASPTSSVFETLICRALSKAKCGKAAGPFLIIAETLKASGRERSWAVELARKLTGCFQGGKDLN